MSPQLTSKVTQELIDNHIANLVRRYRDLGLGEAPKLTTYLNPEDEVRVIGDSKDLNSIEYSKPFMLASVSKVALALALTNLLTANYSTEEIHSQLIKIDSLCIRELIGRDPARINNNPIYAELKNRIDPGLLDEAIAAQAADDQIKHTKIRDQIFQELGDIKIEIVLEELLYQALYLSSNNATRIIKDLIRDFGGDLKSELAKIAPYFQPSPEQMDELQHWRPDILPNVGHIEEIGEIMHALAQKLANLQAGDSENIPNVGEQLIIDSMKNNQTKIRHAFSVSELGKWLIKQGYTLLEKTGYYECVFWITNPAYDYPAHMVVATVVSIVSPVKNGSGAPKVHTFVHHRLVPVRVPTNTQENSKTKLTTPEVDLHYIASIANPVYHRVSKEFIDELSQKVVAELGLSQI